MSCDWPLGCWRGACGGGLMAQSLANRAARDGPAAFAAVCSYPSTHPTNTRCSTGQMAESSTPSCPQKSSDKSYGQRLQRDLQRTGQGARLTGGGSTTTTSAQTRLQQTPLEHRRSEAIMSSGGARRAAPAAMRRSTGGWGLTSDTARRRHDATRIPSCTTKQWKGTRKGPGCLPCSHLCFSLKK